MAQGLSNGSAHFLYKQQKIWAPEGSSPLFSSLRCMPHLTHRKQMGVQVGREQSSCFHDSEDTWGLNTLRGRLAGPLSLGCFWQVDEPFPGSVYRTWQNKIQ